MRHFLAMFVTAALLSAALHAARAETAVLYQEIPGAPGRRTEGTVEWQASENGVTALARFPKKPSISLLFKKNDNSSVPATHVIDITFTPCTGVVSKIPGVLSKPEETMRGTPLAGLSVKYGCDRFVIGLSTTPEDRERNSDLIVLNDWLDIPVVYSNGRRSILAIKKGNIGSPAIAALFGGTVTQHEPQQDPCNTLPRPRIGMTAAALVGTCWGKPRRIVKKTTAAGVEESYVYSLGHIVTLVDGKVTEIVESE